MHDLTNIGFAKYITALLQTKLHTKKHLTETPQPDTTKGKLENVYTI